MTPLRVLQTPSRIYLRGVVSGHPDDYDSSFSHLAHPKTVITEHDSYSVDEEIPLQDLWPSEQITRPLRQKVSVGDTIV
ncbi:MAG: hypothetical protein M1820_007477 [Bogoriella megaspora]|nr:MAG: hypothetical protein M1820_007477 [Bogoriella megaspora]